MVHSVCKAYTQEKPGPKMRDKEPVTCSFPLLNIQLKIIATSSTWLEDLKQRNSVGNQAVLLKRKQPKLHILMH